MEDFYYARDASTQTNFDDSSLIEDEKNFDFRLTESEEELYLPRPVVHQRVSNKKHEKPVNFSTEKWDDETKLNLQLTESEDELSPNYSLNHAISAVHQRVSRENSVYKNTNNFLKGTWNDETKFNLQLTESEDDNGPMISSNSNFYDKKKSQNNIKKNDKETHNTEQLLLVTIVIVISLFLYIYFK